MTRVISVVLFILIFSVGPIAAEEVLDGTWKLVSSTRTNTTTGATTDSFGPNPLGYIMYGKDGRMMVLITRSDRPKPDSTDKMTDEQRSRLFSSMLAYSGTYKFDGETIEHHIDGSWNQVWTGTTQIRNVKKDGDRLIYTTQPGPSPIDGSMGFATLVWEKVK
jgi:Lipocalin-like domain